MTRLRARGLTLGYDGPPIVENLDVALLDGKVTAIVGANACGKSTLLRALARMLKPRGGQVLLDGRRISSRPSKEVARELGLLPQSPLAPDGITVADLVGRGRYPHQGLLRQWSREDERAVQAALAATHVDALALAQETPILLLDEPTTFLDIAHQVEVLDLCADLHEHHGRTLVAVLHDLNHACRYASHLIAMRDGAIVAQGDPRTIVTAALVEEVFGLACRVIECPETGAPLVVPAARAGADRAARAARTPPLAVS